MKIDTDFDFTEIEKVKSRIKEIQIELAGHSISRNRKSFKADTISQEVVDRRALLVPELLKLENSLRGIKQIYQEKRNQDPDILWKDTLYELLVEIIGKDEYKKIVSECINRISGGESKKIILNYGFSQQDKDEIKRLTKLSNSLKETLHTARKGVDRYIRANEPEINKADYQTKIKELIKCMPSEKEIYSINITKK